MAVVQSTYTTRMRAGLPGMVVNEVPYRIDTRIVEPSSGLPFGVACKQGASDKGVGVGGALTGFVGISVRDVTLDPVAIDSDYVDEYVQYANAGILNMGDIWVTTDDTVAAGDAVHYNATTGVLGNSGGTGPVPGARWKTSVTGAGLAVVSLSGIHRA